jgi:DNA-binding transcriptional LysR family regulator
MEQFSALRLLVSVVDDGGFTAAANKLGLSTSVVSRQIAALEAELAVTLLKRTTRTVELTQAGNTYLNHIRPLLTELHEANTALRNANSGVGGRFRVAAPSAIGLSLIALAIADFMAVNPTIIGHFDLLDRRVDAFEEDYDLVLQLGDAPEHAGILAQIEMGVFASPGYCALHNRPHGPSDLPAHRGLFLTSQTAWELRGGSEFQPKQQFTTNRLEALKSLCLGGQGIALLPVFLVRAENERGELLQLLNGFEPKPFNLFAVTPLQKRETASTKAFRIFLEARFKRLRL